MVFVDADISWPTGALYRLARSRKAVIGATYRPKQDEVRFHIHGRVEKVGGLYRVDGLPGGFIKISRRAIEAMSPKAYLASDGTPTRDYFPMGWHRGRYFGEDYGFCRLWRAAGSEVWLDPSIQLRHHDGMTVFIGDPKAGSRSIAMALSTKADLKTKAASWLRRSGNAAYVAEVPDFIALAEARLNRELGPVETDATRTGTVGSRQLDISTLAVNEPLALFITASSGGDEREMQPQAPANIEVRATSGWPTVWCMDGKALKFDRPCDQAYGFRFRFRERFALGADESTNWLLTNHPDLYLAATLMWGAGYLESWENGSVWKGLLGEGLAEVKRQLAERKRGTLRVDGGLLAMGGRLR